MNFLNKEEIKEIVTKYPIGNYKSHKHLDNVLQNYVCILRTSRGKYILKYMLDVDIKHMKKQLGLIDFLHSKRIPVIKNIPDKSGKSIIVYKKGWVIIQEFVEGKHPEKFNDNLVKDVANNVGKMHKVLLKSKYSKQSKHHQYKKKDLSESKKLATVSRIQDNLLKEIGRINKNKLKQTLIHGDLSEINLIVKDNKLKAFIDWDDSDLDYIVYEIAIFIAHTFIRSEVIYKDKIRLFLREYQRHVKLNDEEKKALYLLIKYRQLGILYWHLKYIKTHKDKAKSLKKGIVRSVNRLCNYDKMTFEEFLKLFD